MTERVITHTPVFLTPRLVTRFNAAGNRTIIIPGIFQGNSTNITGKNPSVIHERVNQPRFVTWNIPVKTREIPRKFREILEHFQENSRNISQIFLQLFVSIDEWVNQPRDLSSVVAVLTTGTGEARDSRRGSGRPCA